MPAQLTNLIVPGQASPPSPPAPVAGIALIDSGASMTAVDDNALKQLGVAPVGIAPVLTPSGSARQLLYPADIVITGMPGRHSFTQVIGTPHLAAQGIVALIGRDVLRNALFVYNGSTGQFTLAF
jgi:hypothetical protein